MYRLEETGWVHHDHQLLQACIAVIDSEPGSIFRASFWQNREVIGLTDIKGASEASIHVIGLNGFLSHFNGLGWRNFDQVIASNLNSIFIETNENVWVAGAGGTLLSVAPFRPPRG